MYVPVSCDHAAGESYSSSLIDNENSDYCVTNCDF